MNVEPKAALPVLVLTGFLGSGKTTLLNRLLRDGPRAAVLINEFGTTPVDQQLIEREGLPLMTLAGGCQDTSLMVWNVKSGKNLAMSGYPGKVTRLAWDAGSRFFATGAANEAVLWDFSGAGPAQREPRVLSRHVDRTSTSACAPTNASLPPPATKAC
jgi:WD40 repeat protein